MRAINDTTNTGAGIGAAVPYDSVRITRHAQSTVAADGTEDDAAVEVMARAIGDAYETHGQQGHLRAKRPSVGMLNAFARAALAALRGMGE